MALFAAQAGVPAQQRVAGQAMVEFVLGRLPFDDSEVLAVMLSMAASAIHIALARADRAPVVALMRADQRANLIVTIQTSEFGRAGAEDMTTGALQWTIQRLVSLGQWTR